MSTEKTKREIECLARLKHINGSLDDVYMFLLENKLINTDQIKAMRQAVNESKQLKECIDLLRREDRLQLSEFYWKLLPKEELTITLVSDRQTKEFGF
jgi:hypothetical protein